ncbi:hypothetical protein GCM10029964_097980 [Kibdelosporangium lantanae]
MNITPGEVVDDHTDVITARRYGHDALDRPVVRLVPRSLGPAEDLSLEFLGFTEPARVTEVGSGRREAIGFPAWALVHDPANAHHALNLVKDVERLTRTAKSKPGAAKDGFDRLAEMLGRSAPHFLPTFYEQAGRVFVEAGNAQYAGTMLSKAREAEEVHSLDVDTVHQRQVFLEFALAGALSAKAITKYARTLAARRPPVEAYDEFTALCVERTKGGLPPYAGMQDDLRRLAKAAKLDLAQVEQDFLRQVLDAPAITRASHSFWSSYRKSLVTLATREPRVRARLLEIVPEVASQDLWVGMLVESGAATALVDGEPGAAAAWMSRFVPSRVGYWQHPVVRSAALVDLVVAMAPRLRADGVPVEVLNRHRGTDLDVLDVCLAEDVPLATWPESVDTTGDGTPTNWNQQPQLAVEEWLADSQPGRRDLTALADNEIARTLLAYRLVRFVFHGKKTVDLDPVLAVPGLRTVLRHWLADRAEEINDGSAVTIRHVLDVLRPVRSAEAFADVPEAAQRIAGTDVAGALAARLRGGLFAEFGWPALEEAITSLGSSQNGDNAVVAGEGWPALVVNRGDRFVAVGPDGILVDHVLRMTPEYRPTRLTNAHAGYVDGQLYIGWHSPRGVSAAGPVTRTPWCGPRCRGRGGPGSGTRPSRCPVAARSPASACCTPATPGCPTGSPCTATASRTGGSTTARANSPGARSIRPPATAAGSATPPGSRATRPTAPPSTPRTPGSVRPRPAPSKARSATATACSGSGSARKPTARGRLNGSTASRSVRRRNRRSRP